MKILVGIDGSSSSLKAAKYAVRLVSELQEGSTLTLISVHDDTALNHFRRYVPKGVIRDYLRELCDTDLKKSRNYLDKHKIPYDMLVEFGNPVEQILAACARQACDLIVLGAKGRTMINDLLVGSVALRVASAAKTPVTLVK
jgi:nucleotide-binding universal stress UspA family protein